MASRNLVYVFDLVKRLGGRESEIFQKARADEERTTKTKLGAACMKYYNGIRPYTEVRRKRRDFKCYSKFHATFWALVLQPCQEIWKVPPGQAASWIWTPVRSRVLALESVDSTDCLSLLDV